MKKSTARIGFIALLAVLSMLLNACGKTAELSCPFTAASWDWTKEDVIASEGEVQETLVSVYGGETYTYAKEYLGYPGTVKYMFSDKGKLASVAWAFISSEPEEIKSVFTQIDEAETAKNGKSQFSSENSTSYGNVWYMKSHDVVVSTIFGAESGGLQYAYINHSFSKH